MNWLTSFLPTNDTNFTGATDRLSHLALIKYQKNPYLTEIEDLNDQGNSSLNESSSYEESFPWLVDSNGQNIDLNKDIRLFDGVQLVSRYLEQRLKMDPNLIPEVKLTELLEQFQENKEITVGDLFDHVYNLYKKDQDGFKSKMVENLISSNDSTADLSNNISEPLGKFGNITLNEIATSLKDLKWDLLLNNAQVTVNAIPLAANVMSYSLILRSYYKYVHNRPYDPTLSKAALKLQQANRNRTLMVFALVGAPITLVFLNQTAVPMKDIFTINVSAAAAPTDNSNALFLLISKFFNKIPDYIKLLFKLIVLIIIVLKLLGFESIGGFFFNAYYLKLYILITSSLVIIYQLINIYLIHKASNGMKISEVLPEFIINWLKEFETLSSSKASIKEFKNMCYIQIAIYIVIILLILLIN